MKTKNFPERKNQRRKAALHRFLNPKEIKNPDYPKRRDEMIANTRAKIIDDASGIKSKKVQGR